MLYVRSLRTHVEADKSKFKSFAAHAARAPRVLHILLVDECHWGMGAKSATRAFLVGDLGQNFYTLPNALVVMVSATPFNHLAENSAMALIQVCTTSQLVPFVTGNSRVALS